MQDRGQKITVCFYMENNLYPPTPSRNLLIDLIGSELPHEYGKHFLHFNYLLKLINIY